MGYRQQFHDSIVVSGYASRTVGPSQSSQTVNIEYREVVPLDIVVDVVTEPFDSSVIRCNDSIDRLSGAVAGMNAAQCAAITQNAGEVSQSLLNGFYGTIKTELSQQVQALDSAIKAGLGLILEQGKAVTGQKSVMETDYHRISSRYMSLFSDLDEECKKRIYALDKPAFMLSEKVQQGMICEEGTNTSAKNLTVMAEESSSKMMIVVSGMARKTMEIMRALGDYITQEKRFSSLVNSFMNSESAGSMSELYVPVVYTESDLLNEKGSTAEQHVPGDLSPAEKESVFEKTGAFCRDASSCSWEPMDDHERELLNKEFHVLAEKHYNLQVSAEPKPFAGSENQRQRVHNTLMELWRKSGLDTAVRRTR
jgi:hypothetical protein